MSKEFTIDRSKWLRGEVFPGVNSVLCDRDGRKCCLGFYLESCGVSPGALTDEPCPEDVAHDIPEEAEWLVYGKYGDDPKDSVFAEALISANDEVSDYTEEEREQLITGVFADRGVTVHFVDGVKT